MRKLFIFITVLFFPFLFITCKQYNVNIEDYLSYWSGEAYVTAHTVEAVPLADKDGIKSVSSAKKVVVTLKLSNPKKIPLIMPTSAADAGKFIRFKGLSQQPVFGADYTFTQTTDTTLQLVYTDAFLQAHEWGNGGIGADITLYAKDGRKFTKSYAYTLKVNTPPPQPRVTIAKTTGEPAYYVLCIKVPEMDNNISGGLLHKDISRIDINKLSYTFSVNEAQTAFVKPDDSAFITSANVEKLTAPNADEVSSGGWVLYYKTDAEVKDGAAKKDYTVTLKDQAGLASETLNASTNPAATTYTVTFDARGGTPVPVAQTVAHGGKAADPSASVSKTGAYLDGWYTETAYTYKWDFNTDTVTGNLTLYAKWTAGSGTAYTVKHYQQNIDGSYPTAATYTDNLQGSPGQNAAVTLKNYPGFEAGTYTPATIAAGGNTIVKVYYQRKTCAVTYSVNGSGGSIAVTAVTGGIVSTSPVTVKYGGSVTFKASPDPGYEVDSWSSNVTETPSTDRKEATLSTVTGAATVTVQFKKRLCTVTFNVDGGHGSLKATPAGGTESTTGSITVEHGKKVTFTATPTDATSYKVGDWTCTPSAGFTGVSGQQNASLTVTADTTVSVQFVHLNALSLSTLTIHGKNAANGSVTLPYTVTQVAESDINLAFSGHSGITFTVGQTLPLTLQPGVPQSITINVAASSGHYPAWTKTVNITRAKNDKAKLQSFTLNGDTKTATSDGSFASEYEVASDMATVAGFIFAAGSDEATASVSPVGAVNIPAGAGKSFTITVKAQDGTETQTVTFTVKRKKYTVNYNVAGGKGGTIQAGSETAAASGSTQVEHGGGVTFTAKPDTGWEVDSWSTNVTVTPSTDNKKATLSSVTQATDKNVTVTFKPTGLPSLVIDQNLSGAADKKTISGTEKPHTGQATDDIVASGLYRNSSAPLVLYNKSGSAKLKLSAPTGATAHYALNGSSPGAGSGISVDSTQTHKLEVWIERDGVSGVRTTLYIKLLPYLNTYTALKNVVTNVSSGAAVEITVDTFDYAASDSEITISGNKKLILMSKDANKKDIGRSGTGRLFKITGNSTVVLKDVNLVRGSVSDGKGGAVYVEAGSTFGLSGNASVTPGAAKGNSDVYLATGAFIKADSVLAASSPVARITPAAYTEAELVLKVNDGLTGLLNSEHAKFAVTPQDLGGGKTQEWEINNNGRLAKKQFIIDPSDPSTLGGKSAWAALKAAVETGSAEKITVRGSVKATLDDTEIAVARKIEIIGDGTDAGLDAQGLMRIFKVSSTGKLTLRDLTLKGGFINAASDYGGAIHNAGALTIISCDITESKVSKPTGGGIGGIGGGGIYIAEGAKCTITGTGTRKSLIRKNEAPKGAGIQVDGECTIGEYTVIGGSIVDANTGKQFGGGILVGSTGKCTVKSGVEISYNTLSAVRPFGGGIYVEESSGKNGELILEGTSGNPVRILGNQAVGTGGEGGGIYVEGTASMQYTEIKDCTATHGGGVFIKGNKAVFTMKAASRIIPSGSPDTDKPGKNDVYLGDDATIRIEGAWSGTEPVARITPKTYSSGIQVLDEGTTGLLSSEYTRFTVTPQTVPSQQKWIIDDQGKLRELIGGSSSNSTDKWNSLKTAVSSATDGNVFFIEGEYTMPSGGDTLEPSASCTIRGTNNAVLDGGKKGMFVSIGASGSATVTLENLTIKNGKDGDYALSAYQGSSFYLKNVTVNSTKKILQSNSGDVTFDNVKALGTDSIIELGGGNSGSGEIAFSYLKVKGDTTEIQGTVKLAFRYSHSEYSGAIMICDKKAYSLRLDFGSDYNNAKDKQVVFLDSTVSGFTLAEAVAHITVVNGGGGSQWHIDSNGFLRKK